MVEGDICQELFHAFQRGTEGILGVHVLTVILSLKKE